MAQYQCSNFNLFTESFQKSSGLPLAAKNPTSSDGTLAFAPTLNPVRLSTEKMAIRDMRHEFIQKYALPRKIHVSNLRGKTLLWDLSAIWFKFNIFFPKRIWEKILTASRSKQIMTAVDFLKSEGVNVELIADGTRIILKAGSGGMPTTAHQLKIIGELNAGGHNVTIPPGEFDQYVTAKARADPENTYILSPDSTDMIAGGANVVEYINFMTSEATVIYIKDVLKWMRPKFNQSWSDDQLLDALALCAAIAPNDYNLAARIKGISFTYMLNQLSTYSRMLGEFKNLTAHQLCVKIVREFYRSRPGNRHKSDLDLKKELDAAMANVMLAYAQFQYPVWTFTKALGEQMPVDVIGELKINDSVTLDVFFPQWQRVFLGILYPAQALKTGIPFPIADKKWVEDMYNSRIPFCLEDVLAYLHELVAVYDATDMPSADGSEFYNLCQDVQNRATKGFYSLIGIDYKLLATALEPAQLLVLLDDPLFQSWCNRRCFHLTRPKLMDSRFELGDEVRKAIIDAVLFNFEDTLARIHALAVKRSATDVLSDDGSEFYKICQGVQVRATKSFYLLVGLEYRKQTVALEPAQLLVLLDDPLFQSWCNRRCFHLTRPKLVDPSFELGDEVRKAIMTKALSQKNWSELVGERPPGKRQRTATWKVKSE